MPPRKTPAEKTARQQEESPAPQQQVLSIRVNEALRYRLEHLKRMHLAKTGESLSTSEIARLLLESARDDRLEFVKLMAEPMKSLLNARRKLDARLPLSQTEWMLIAYYCQLGAEAFEDSMPNQISNESLAGILEAFLAVYDLDPAKRTPTDSRYIANLPVDEEIGKKRPVEIKCEDVRYLTKKTIRALKNPAPFERKPLLAARNLFFVLDTTVFPSMEMLNEALLPHWPILWRVCARGFYFHNSKPLVDEPGKEVYDPFVDPPLPVFEESECGLVLPRAKYGGFGLLLKLPGKLALIVPLYEFVIICEFRAMIERFDAEHEKSFWRGYYLSAYTKKLETGEAVVTLRLNENGVQFDLERGSWQAFRNLLHRAWEHPEVRRLWNDSVLRYGEF